MVASIDRELFSKMLSGAAQALIDNEDRLSQIDSQFGDGDHGVAMGRIARTIQTHVTAWGDESFHDFIEALSDDVLATGGGSAGSLYGVMIGGMASPLSDEETIDAPLLKEMFASMAADLSDISGAKVGDKTMVDALFPAVEAAQAAPDDVGGILHAAATAAHEGMERSEGFASKFGRARSYGDATIGTPDAGAVSCALFIAGLASPFA